MIGEYQHSALLRLRRSIIGATFVHTKLSKRIMQRYYARLYLMRQHHQMLQWIILLSIRTKEAMTMTFSKKNPTEDAPSKVEYAITPTDRDMWWFKAMALRGGLTAMQI